MPDMAQMLDIVSGRRRGIVAGCLRFGLGVLTPGYRTAVWLRNLAFDRGWKKTETAGVPVISIGNLTTGGTGKTPLVIWLAKLLREQDLRVAVLSRGYKPIEGRANDESLELQRAIPDVPVLENPDRVASATIAVEELEMQLLLLDDGFQHRRLARDLNIVLIDATNPFGYGRLLPRGLLREPLAALRRADAVVITRANLVGDDALASIRYRIGSYVQADSVAIADTVPQKWVRAEGQSYSLDHLNDQPLLGICGIGNPKGFFSLLRQLGFRLCQEVAFPDHHHYTDQEIETIAAHARDSGAASIVCTVKDLVKLDRNRIGQFPLLALETETRFRSGEETLRKMIDRRIAESAIGT